MLVGFRKTKDHCYLATRLEVEGFRDQGFVQVVFSLCPGFHTGFELGGGGEHGGSRMIVVREAHSRTYKCVCLLGGSGGMLPPRKILNLDPLRLLLTQSGTRLLFNICDKTLITILNFKI